MANDKIFGLKPTNVEQEVAVEVMGIYHYIHENFVKFIYNGEEARNSACATIIIATKDRMKGVYGLADKFQKALADKGALDTKLLDVWMFVLQGALGEKFHIAEEDMPKVRGYVAHLIGMATPNEEMIPKCVEYIYNNLGNVNKEQFAKDFGL